MGSNVWEKQKIGEIALINMGQSPESKYYNNERIGLPFLQGNRTFGFKYPTYDSFCSSGNKFADPNDILISVRAPVGDLNIAKERICIGRGLSSLKMKNGNYEYLFYLLKANIQELINRESGTVFGSINKDDIYNLEVIIAKSDDDQRRIAEILSALDDKIELNRQTNATLEAIAQAIFKEWFVDFNFPGATGEMVESELGLIPKEWRVGRLGEVCKFSYGKGLKLECRMEGVYPVVGSSGIIDTHNEYMIEGPGIVVGRKGTIGEVTWVHKNFFPIDTTFYIIDLIGVNNLYFHYFLLKEQDFKKIGSDSAVPGLNRKQAYGNLIIVPTIEVIYQFNNIIHSLFTDINNRENESFILSAIRDTLLPKLMNGEIEV